jgi:hypothetical protein
VIGLDGKACARAAPKGAAKAAATAEAMRVRRRTRVASSVGDRELTTEAKGCGMVILESFRRDRSAAPMAASMVAGPASADQYRNS